MTIINSVPESWQAQRPSPELQRLGVFVGKWNMEGIQFEGVIGPAAKITALQTYEWLTGGLFLIHRFEGRVGHSDAACIEITSYDPSRNNYLTRSFYNNGITNDWMVRELDGIWMLRGDWQINGRSLRVRCTTVFGNSGDTMTSNWEHFTDNAKWQTFWDVRATKAR
jgi:hypothetical protein